MTSSPTADMTGTGWYRLVLIHSESPLIWMPLPLALIFETVPLSRSVGFPALTIAAAVIDEGSNVAHLGEQLLEQVTDRDEDLVVRTFGAHERVQVCAS